uniref:G-protein coupled receptors family 1 profile domain-containing protein n=1 Tax=Balaenoptera musculus TaxID=9771 RepID=A0A8C0CTC0_BALMU
MGRDNQTGVTEFILLGLSGQSEQEKVLFGLFLWMYLVTLIGNLLIVLATNCDSHLQTPMYFFLAHLSCVDICFSSVTIPKMLVNHILGSKSVSYMECMTQIYFFIIFINMDGFLLSVMAYDDYTAICCPLHYTMIRRPKLCVLLVAASRVSTNLHALLHTLLMVQLTFCSNNAVYHFFCDPYPILKLSCSNTFINDLMVFTVGGLVFMTPFTCIIISYDYIFSNVLKLPSAHGIRKALSTYVVTTVIFTVVTPLVNPFIYSLRNHDTKGALRKLISYSII